MAKDKPDLAGHGAEITEPLEDVSDAAAFDHGADAIALDRGLAERFGIEIGIPFAVVERIMDGASPLRAWREHRGLTQEKLAGMVGMARPYLALLEQGKKDGGIDVWRRLARSLRVLLEDILPEMDDEPVGNIAGELVT